MSCHPCVQNNHIFARKKSTESTVWTVVVCREDYIRNERNVKLTALCQESPERLLCDLIGQRYLTGRDCEENTKGSCFRGSSAFARAVESS
jgi:hypothetical protein